MISLVLVPGLVAAGIGALIFIGLDSLTGLGTTSLEIPSLPPAGTPTIAEFGWAFAIGVAAAIIGTAIRWIGLTVRPAIDRRLLVGVPAAGLVVAVLAVLYVLVTDKNATDVLFSGQAALPHLIATSAEYSVGTLILLMICKGIGYGVSLGGFRGGPIFPSMYLGAALGMAASHLPGLGLIPGIAMGIGAMCVTMLGFPLVSVLLATLLLASDGLQVMPLVIVAVVVAYLLRAWLSPLLPGADRAKTERTPQLQPGSSQRSPTLVARSSRDG
jgi:MFS family permease